MFMATIKTKLAIWYDLLHKINLKDTKVIFSSAIRRSNLKRFVLEKISLQSAKHPADDTIIALDIDSLTITSGEKIGIIGPNGAGKTTLLRVLAGLLPPTAGTVDINGEPTVLINIMLGFNEHLSGLDNIYVRGLRLGLSRDIITELIPNIVEFSGLDRFVNQPIKNYSSGMKLRLAFSIVVHINSDILIMDEWLSVGDETFREKSNQFLRNYIHNSNVCVIASHDLNLISNFCSKAIYMKAGKIAGIGTPKEVIDDYRSDG